MSARESLSRSMLHKQQKHEWIKAAKADRVLMQPASQAGEDAVAERVMGDLVQRADADRRAFRRREKPVIVPR